MNTKTMRLPPRRISMPNTTNTNTNNNKRKERDDFDLKHFTPPAKSPKPAFVPLAGSGKAAQAQVQTVSSNQLLAGYLAHEFLTRGTLFGQQWGPPRPQPTTTAEFRKGTREEAEPSQRSKAGEAELEPEPEPEPETGLEPKPKNLRYVEVASLLKTDGAHIPGIVNPTQLARFLQM